MKKFFKAFFWIVLFIGGCVAAFLYFFDNSIKTSPEDF